MDYIKIIYDITSQTTKLVQNDLYGLSLLKKKYFAIFGNVALNSLSSQIDALIDKYSACKNLQKLTKPSFDSHLKQVDRTFSSLAVKSMEILVQAKSRFNSEPKKSESLK